MRISDVYLHKGYAGLPSAVQRARADLGSLNCPTSTLGGTLPDKVVPRLDDADPRAQRSQCGLLRRCTELWLRVSFRALRVEVLQDVLGFGCVGFWGLLFWVLRRRAPWGH